MEKEFVTYELALRLKEFGFDEPCFGTYDSRNSKLYEWSNAGDIKAPLYQQAFRFFREKYELEGITQQAEDFVWYKWKISQYNEDGKKYVADWYEYETYEEAELACLKKLIEIAEQNKK